jgi:hypothetical protein
MKLKPRLAMDIDQWKFEKNIRSAEAAIERL